MSAMNAPDSALLADLLDDAGLPHAFAIAQLTGRGFDNAVYRVTLVDDRRVVLRRWREPRAPEHVRARFLAEHDLPAPTFLAGNEAGSLHAFVPGVLLGDLIETGQDTEENWHAVGRAFRRVHAVTFSPGLGGNLLPDRFVLTPIDPVALLHRQI